MLFISTIQKRIKERLLHVHDQQLLTQLSRSGIGSIILKLFGTLLGLSLTVVLSRALGAENYGVYAYILVLITLLIIPAQLGLPNLVVRETAKMQAEGQWGLLRGLWRWTTRTVGFLSLGVVITSLILLWFFSEHLPPAYSHTFLAGLILVPLTVLGNLRGAALRGLREVVWGQFPELVLKPLLLIVMLLIALSILQDGQLSSVMAMGLNALAALAAFLVGVWLLVKKRPASLNAHPKHVYMKRIWFVSSIPLLFASSMQMVNEYADILIMGFFVPAEEIGRYRIAAQGALLVGFGLQTMNMVVAPHFARIYTLGDMAKLQRVVTLSARVSFMLALPVSLMFVLWGELILGVVFGSAYAKGHVVLALLALGQLVNSLMGSVGFLLIMTNHERDAVRAMAIAAVSNIILNLLLIPVFGINGAAAATTSTVIIWNFLLRRDVKRRLGIESMATVVLQPALSR